MIDFLSEISEQKGGFFEQGIDKRDSIINSDDNLVITGTKYYISENGDDSADGKSPKTAWRTLDKLKQFNKALKSGDGVFFERGSVFRQENTVHSALHENNAIWAVSGVSYGAYGVGDKPKFYGSPFNYAEFTWELHSKNIWKINIDLQDAGIIVFNFGEYIGVKKSSLSELKEDYQFYHDVDQSVFYLYLEKDNPSKLFYDIEIGFDRPIFLFGGNVGNVTIDNLDIRYSGAHAISAYEFNRNITISNCIVSWVGGSWQKRDVVRYGNAIQFWNECSKIEIKNCWIHHVYDAGLTFQGPPGAKYEDISFDNNLIQYCNYSIEFFIQGTNNEEYKNNLGELKNISFCNNIMQYSGYGVCEQRPDLKDSAHICGWITDVGKSAQCVRIENNIFDTSAYHLVYWVWNQHDGAKISGNTFYTSSTVSGSVMKYGNYGDICANNQETLEKAISVFDSKPKNIIWKNQ